MKKFLLACAALFTLTCISEAQIAGGGAALGGGQVGQVVQVNVPSGSAVTYTTTATSYNLATLSLPAGHWACQANVVDTAAGTTFPSAIIAFSTTSATLPTAPQLGYTQYAVSATTTVGGGSSGIALFDFNSAPNLVYAVIQAAFTGTAPTAYGSAQCWQRG